VTGKGCKGKLFLSILGGIILLLVLGNVSWAVPIARIDVLDPLIYPEEQFQINIVAEGVEPMDAALSFGFDLDFDSTWTLDSVVMGGGFSDDSGFFLDTDVAGSAMPAIGGGADILLTSLYFTPHQAGIFSFDIVSDITLFSEGLFTFEYSPPFTSQIDITTSTSVSVVPEPATGLLLFFGLGFVGWLKKRKGEL